MSTSLSLGVVVLSLLVVSEAAGQQLQWQSRGVSREDRLGNSIDVTGDFDGDGLPDVLAGAPNHVGVGHFQIIGSGTGSVLVDFAALGRGDEFGNAVASLGDVDGDGVADFAIGAPGDYRQGIGSGVVQVRSGATRALLFEVFGPAPHGYFGRVVVAAGDLDGDGKGDFLDASVESSTVYAYSGATGAFLWKVSGSNSSFGASACVVGDVDGDSVPDFAIGSPRDATVGSNQGAVYLVSGASQTLLRTFLAPAGQDDFGSVVAAAPDCDGDGVPDVLVSNPRFSNDPFKTNERGAVWLFSSATGARLAKAIGTFDHENLGVALAPCDDVDGDGRPDFAAGGADQFAGLHVFSSATGLEVATLSTRNGFDVLKLFPDLDGDGRRDLVAGNAAEGGASGGGAYAGSVFGFSGADGATLFAAWGEELEERRGAAVAVFDDLDHDGWRDLLVGSPADDATDPGEPGAVRILSGRDASELRVHLGAVNGEWYGAAVLAIPDCDGDGVREYALSAPRAATNQVAVEVRSGSSGTLLHALSNRDSSSAPRYGASLAAGTSPNGRIVLAVGDPVLGGVDVYDMATGALFVSLTGTASTDFGSTVAFAGDLDGDGEGDWSVGAPLADQMFAQDCGAVVVTSGATGTTLRTLFGSNYGFIAAKLGSSLASIGDLDGDGLADVLAGAPYEGIQSPGTVAAINPATGTRLFTVTGPLPNGEFGRGVAALGDVNRDGIDDFAVACRSNVQPPDVAAWVFSGATQTLLGHVLAENGQLLGPVLATAPPGAPTVVDPDGIPDLVVGTPHTVPYDGGSVALYRLDDLMLEATPSTVTAGQAIDLETRGGPSGNLAGLFLVAFDATPQFDLLALGAFDALGDFDVGATVPPGLNGHVVTLRSCGIGFAGRVEDSNDGVVTIQ